MYLPESRVLRPQQSSRRIQHREPSRSMWAQESKAPLDLLDLLGAVLVSKDPPDLPDLLDHRESAVLLGLQDLQVVIFVPELQRRTNPDFW